LKREDAYFLRVGFSPNIRRFKRSLKAKKINKE
jgi:hypothetical protein